MPTPQTANLDQVEPLESTEREAQLHSAAVTIMPTPQTANLDQVQPLESTEREAQLRSAEIQGSDPMDKFLENITHHLEQPLLPTPSIVFEPEQIDMVADTDYTQRKSSRLADKAKTRVGKDSMKLAQELLSKKLGELTTGQPSSSEANFDNFSQHFVKPINMVQMEALQVLVEHGTKLEKAGKNKGAARQMEVA
jgi:hypothetical protein